jgi:NTE family protein
MTSRALVLGGGGIAGIAWETGLLFGLAEHGIDVLAADLIVGTSAGAAVAAQITSGEKLAALHDRHAFPEGESTELAVEFDVEQMVADWGRLLETHAPGAELRAAIGSYALAAPTVPERKRREVIDARLTKHEWPDRAIKIVAVDAVTGEERIFTADDGVDLVDAVAASCAVPGVWPPVTIQGKRYIDGGVRSPINLDVAAGSKVILVLAPSGELGPVDPDVGKAAEKVEKKSMVVTLRPDEASLAAMGLNPLDPDTAQPSAQAGRAQAETVADEVRELWAEE